MCANVLDRFVLLNATAAIFADFQAGQKTKIVISLMIRKLD